MNPHPVWLEERVDAIQSPITDVPDFGAGFDAWDGTGPATARWTVDMSPPIEAHGQTPQLAGFELSDPAAIQDYVGVYPFLEVALAQARDMILDCFGRARLHLRIERLPSEDWEPKLVLRIGSDLPLEDALRRLGSFSRDWWPGRARAVEQRVRITLE